MNASALLLELEGVVAYTLPHRATALHRALSGRGIHVTAAATARAAAGRSPAEALARLGPAVTALDDTDRAIVAMQAEQEFSSLLAGGVVLAPAAMEFVRAAHAEVPLGIVTRARRVDADLILELSGLRDGFIFTVCAEDAIVPKPDPSPYRAAMERLCRRGVTRDGIIALEDGAAGIDSARAADLWSVGVGPLPDDEAFHADAWLPSLARASVQSIGEMLQGTGRER